MEFGLLRLIKILDISLLGIYYFFLAVISSIIIQKLFPKFSEDEYKKKTKLIIFLEICLRISLLVVSVYFIRRIIHFIPFYFDGYMGYHHDRLKEINGVVILAFAILMFQADLKLKTLHLVKRITNTNL